MKSKENLQLLFKSVLNVNVEIQDNSSDPLLAARQVFVKMINTWEESWEKQNNIYELGIDLSGYDLPLYNVIENLIRLMFGPKKAELIFWYIYSRKNPDESIVKVVDKDNNAIELNNPSELFDLIHSISDSDLTFNDLNESEEDEEDEE
jgi:hypothetical protein